MATKTTVDAIRDLVHSEDALKKQIEELTAESAAKSAEIGALKLVLTKIQQQLKLSEKSSSEHYESLNKSIDAVLLVQEPSKSLPPKLSVPKKASAKRVSQKSADQPGPSSCGSSPTGCSECNPSNIKVDTSKRCLMCDHVYHVVNDVPAHNSNVIIRAACGHEGYGYDCAHKFGILNGREAYASCGIIPDNNLCWECLI
jgi:hypothetical protein